MKRKTILLIPAFVLGMILLFANGCKKEEEPEIVIDIDGNQYHVITIGTQDWLVENLKVTHYRNGDGIDPVTDNAAWEALTTGAYSNYANDASSNTTYGRLYNFHAVADGRNIAPTGWHVATQDEWEILIAHLGGSFTAGGKLKETGTTHWLTPNTDATNSSGFTALPGGFRNYGGGYEDVKINGGWWTSTVQNTEDAWTYYLNYQTADIYTYLDPKRTGRSVRCIRD